MKNLQATILFPFSSQHEYANLAIKSIIEYSNLPLSLILTVEPGASKKDTIWINNLRNIWPNDLSIYYNKKRLGYYGSINRAILKCQTEIAIIFTSDQVASPSWDSELLKWLKPKRFVTGRLIESGATLLADGTIWKQFGTGPDNFKKEAFLKYCEAFAPSVNIDLPRHYLPMAFYKDDFTRLGMFEEGQDSQRANTHREDFYFFLRSYDQGINIIEAQHCLTYHFQNASRKNRPWIKGLLNWIYPFGLKHIHKFFTGFETIYDALENRGARSRFEKLIHTENF